MVLSRNPSLSGCWLSSWAALPGRTGGKAASGPWAMLDDLHDRTELFEPWIGLGLMVAAFVLALWLLPL